MKAWIGEREGSLPAYRLEDVPQPAPGPDEVLLHVRAVGLNLVDRFPKRAHFIHTPPAPAAIPGIEVAGEIVGTGEAVSGHRKGDRVMAMVHAGCAEYACAHQALLLPIPSGMSWIDAAAVPVSFLTAHDALITNGRFSKDQSLLILGVTTGVGLAAIQLAHLHGASLIAGTSRSPQKLERARLLGLQLGLASTPGLADAILSATGGRGADVVLDHLGARVLDETLRAAAIGGRVVNVGRYAGTRGVIDLELLALRRISLIGVTFRTRSLAEHVAVVSSFAMQHGADLASGALHPVVASVFAFSDLPAAIAHATRGEQFGKLVLEF
jgi:NADPH2:quinone reductase